MSDRTRSAALKLAPSQGLRAGVAATSARPPAVPAAPVRARRIQYLITVMCERADAGRLQAIMLREVYARGFGQHFSYGKAFGTGVLLELGVIVEARVRDDKAAQQVADCLGAEPTVTAARWRIVTPVDR